MLPIIASNQSQVTSETSENERRSPLNERQNQIKNANTKIVMMVILSCLNNIFGRIPVLVQQLLENFYDLGGFYKISCLLVYLSYILNFFIYFYCNKRFREVFKSHFWTLVKFAWIKKIKRTNY